MTDRRHQLWSPTPRTRRERPTSRRSPRRSARGTASTVDGYDALWRWSVDAQVGFLARDVGRRRRHRHARRRRCSSTPTGCRAPQWFPDASLNFAQNLLERKRADDESGCAGVLGRGQDQAAACRTSSCTRWRRARRPRFAAHGHRARRSRRRLRAEHAGGRHRDAGRRRRAARPGRRARRSSACRACWTDSARSRRASSSPSTATRTTAR